MKVLADGEYLKKLHVLDAENAEDRLLKKDNYVFEAVRNEGLQRK